MRGRRICLLRFNIATCKSGDIQRHLCIDSLITSIIVSVDLVAPGVDDINKNTEAVTTTATTSTTIIINGMEGGRGGRKGGRKRRGGRRRRVNHCFIISRQMTHTR